MIDPSRDLQLCFQKYWDMASKGDRNAMMYIADCYLYGWGVNRDFNQYKNILNHAASMGNGNACERLFYEALANQNFYEIDRVLTIWSNRKVDDKHDLHDNLKKTIEIYNSLDVKNIPSMIAAFEMTDFPRDWDRVKALCYQFGYGVEKDSIKSAEIIKNYLGEMYDFSDYIATIIGLYDVGEIPYELIGETLLNKMKDISALDVEYDNFNQGYTQRLLISAACVGNLSSQYFMGQLYLGHDLGIIRPNCYPSDFEAVKWLVITLNNGGDSDVAVFLFELSNHLSQLLDYNNAFKGLYALSNHGYVWGMKLLGNYYYNGWGIPKDCMQAGKWWLTAAQNGDEDAISLVNKIIEIGNGDYWTGIRSL